MTSSRSISGDGWMPPRDGGYRPGRNTTTVTTAKPNTKSVKPPKGGAGVTKAAQRG